MKPGINRLLDLQRLLLAFSHVERRVHRKHHDSITLENDTEHSYNLAMTAWYLCRWFPDLDRDQIIRYAVAHDLVEVYAGDTYIYGDAKELASKQKREADALVRLEKEWNDFPDMTATIREYEKRENNEAKFVYALDKIMPIMIIFINNGHSWKDGDVTVQMLHEAKINKVSESPEILPYFHELHELLLEHPEIIRPR